MRPTQVPGPALPDPAEAIQLALFDPDGFDRRPLVVRVARARSVQAWEPRRAAYLTGHPRCEMCGWRPATQVHHNSYAHVGAEHDSELIALCRPCHARHHGHGSGRRPRDNRP